MDDGILGSSPGLDHGFISRGETLSTKPEKTNPEALQGVGVHYYQKGAEDEWTARAGHGRFCEQARCHPPKVFI